MRHHEEQSSPSPSPSSSSSFLFSIVVGTGKGGKNEGVRVGGGEDFKEKRKEISSET